MRKNKIVQKIKITLKARSLYFVIVGILVTIVIFPFVLKDTEAQNKTVTYQTFYEPPTNTCKVKTGTASITLQEEVLYNRGDGVNKAGGFIYQSNKLYDCCADQLAQFDTVVGCENLPPVTPNPGSVNPWLSTSNGDVHVKFGQISTSNPTAGYFKDNPSNSKKSEYTYSTPQTQAQSGTNLSYNDFLLFNYKSTSIKPPALSGFDGWYDYLYRLAQTNTTVQNKGAIASLTGNTSNTFGAEGAYLVTGNMTIQNNVTCNSRTLVFVDGTLTINPHFKLQNVGAVQACLFIVKGDVTVKPGAAASAGGVAYGTKNYDLLQMGVISQANVIMEYDPADPIKVEGFVVGRKGNFLRDVNDNNFPSVWVEYDPRYIEYFKNELKVLRFSTKEKGYVAPI